MPIEIVGLSLLFYLDGMICSFLIILLTDKKVTVGDCCDLVMWGWLFVYTLIIASPFFALVFIYQWIQDHKFIEVISIKKSKIKRG